MTNREAKELIEKFRAGNCTDAEEAMLKAWYRSLAEAGRSLPAPEIEQALKEISRSLPLEKNGREFKMPFRHIAAAILVLFLFTAGVYFLTEKRPDSQFSGNIYKNDVAPGGNRATLELADGTVIDLNNATIGNLGKKTPVRITKTREDQVVYQGLRLQAGGAPEIKRAAPAYNTIRTPRGGQYQVVLPDGSGAWLNAASSIRFPAIFAGEERKVEITGEVYFEVRQEYHQTDTGKALIPFIVVANDRQIEALGTHFNVNAYADEGVVSATLLEGRVRVSLPGAHTSRLLEPGQQARIVPGVMSPINVSSVDAQRTIAWTNGQFQYDNEGIESIMRQVERWYDVDVVYEGAIPDNKFVGTISRDIPLSKFLDILSYTGVNFRIEGRMIVVIS